MTCIHRHNDFPALGRNMLDSIPATLDDIGAKLDNAGAGLGGKASGQEFDFANARRFQSLSGKMVETAQDHVNMCATRAIRDVFKALIKTLRPLFALDF
jgi:hypothetical protein